MNLKFLKDLLAKRKAKLDELKKRNEESTDIKEVRSLNSEIADCIEEIRSIEENIKTMEDKQDNLDPMKTLGTFSPSKNTRANEDTRSTMEYRTAFMNYAIKGVHSDVLQYRANDQNEASDLGVLLPTTVVDAIITKFEGSYGSLYNRVRKLNIKGGVKYPIGSFEATFNRITENGSPTDRQNGGSITGYVEFSYNIGEIRLAQTLLASVLSVPVFEQKLAETIVKAYLKAMDKEIINGVAANNQCEGILTEANKSTGSRIPTTNIIEMTADEVADWTKWEEKLFAAIPIEMEGLRPEFVMAKQTFVSNLVTLKDNNNQPIKKAYFDVTDKQRVFNEYPVLCVEKDIFKDFNSATNGEYFGMFWIPEEAYAINTNLEFFVKRYFDEEKNQFVDKALVINDGKVLDPKYIYLLKKKVTA